MVNRMEIKILQSIFLFPTIEKKTNYSFISSAFRKRQVSRSEQLSVYTQSICIAKRCQLNDNQILIINQNRVLLYLLFFYIYFILIFLNAKLTNTLRHFDMYCSYSFFGAYVNEKKCEMKYPYNGLLFCSVYTKKKITTTKVNKKNLDFSSNISIDFSKK